MNIDKYSKLHKIYNREEYRPHAETIEYTGKAFRKMVNLTDAEIEEWREKDIPAPLYKIAPCEVERKIKIHKNLKGNFSNASIEKFAMEYAATRIALDGSETYEPPNEIFGRVAIGLSLSEEHAQRLYDWMYNRFVCPATPNMYSAGKPDGDKTEFPISCYLLSVKDTMDEIRNVLWNGSFAFTQKSGGIGAYLGHLREMGSGIKGTYKKANKSNERTSSGIIPWAITLVRGVTSILQGGRRRGAVATYLPFDHVEIDEFIALRTNSGDVHNRRFLNSGHHGVVIKDKHYKALLSGANIDLVSPKHGKNEIISSVPAIELFSKLLRARFNHGEPYILNIDNVNRQRPLEYKILDMEVETSNLCTEIVETTTFSDWQNMRRVAVCCLGSLIVENFEEMKKVRQKGVDKTIYANGIQEDLISEGLYGLDLIVADFLAAVDVSLDVFIEEAQKDTTHDVFKWAAYSAKMERSIGIGVMGLHSYFQKHGVKFGKGIGAALNVGMFSSIDASMKKMNTRFAKMFGSCPDSQEVYRRVYQGEVENVKTYELKRWTHQTSIAPTATISIAMDTSPSIDPYFNNFFKHKTGRNNFVFRNKYLVNLCRKIAFVKAFAGFIETATNETYVEIEEKYLYMYGSVNKFHKSCKELNTEFLSMESEKCLFASNKENVKTFSIMLELLERFKDLREEYYRHEDFMWEKIKSNHGLITGLDEYFNKNIQDIFRASIEIDQLDLIDMCADRQKFIDQAQSFNFYYSNGVSTDIAARDILYAYKRGIKSVYYNRTISNMRPGGTDEHINPEKINSLIEAVAKAEEENINASIEDRKNILKQMDNDDKTCSACEA